jgi:prepilin-type N-terminal cleavage/methylation domain-containing protein
MKKLGRAEGFTLVEVIFALFIGGVLMSAVYVVMISGQKSSAGVEMKAAAQQDVKAALEIMAMEISMASYNPFFESNPGFWLHPPSSPQDLVNDCITPGNQMYRGIQEATPTAITVEMDIGPDGFGDGSIGGSNQTDIVRYSYDATNNYITRTTNTMGAMGCDPAQPFLGADPGTAPAGTRTVTVQNSSMGINNGAGNPAVFRYYDSNGTELYPDTTPANIPNIRRVNITLAVQTEEVDPSTGNPRQMIYSTSVLVRNHAIN